MINVQVMYPNRNDMIFNVNYYIDHHKPLVSRLLAGFGLKYFHLAHGIEPNSPYFMVAELGFETKEEFDAAIDSVGSQIFEDIPKFTNVEPLIQIGELLAESGEPQYTPEA